MRGSLHRETVRHPGAIAAPGLMRQVKAYLVRSRAENRLRQLDDRLLADVGVKRLDIGKAVWGR